MKLKKYHVKQREEISTDTEEFNKDSFISQRARGAYIASLRKTDLTVGFAILAQRQNTTKEDVIQMRKLIRKAKHN